MLYLLQSQLKEGNPRIEGAIETLRQRYADAKTTVLMKDVWEDDPVGEPIAEYDAQHVLDNWFYSGRFHTNDKAVEARQKWSPTAYEWSVIKAMNAVVGVMWEVHALVRLVLEEQGALGDATS